MLFGSEIIIVACGTIAVAVVDRFASSHGFGKLEGVLKLAIPILAIGAAVYFLEFNPILSWLGL